jgi:hypothetical protein
MFRFEHLYCSSCVSIQKLTRTTLGEHATSTGTSAREPVHFCRALSVPVLRRTVFSANVDLLVAPNCMINVAPWQGQEVAASGSRTQVAAVTGGQKDKR